MGDSDFAVWLASLGDKGSAAAGDCDGVMLSGSGSGVTEGVSVSTFTLGDSLYCDDLPPTEDIDCMEPEGEGEL